MFKFDDETNQRVLTLTPEETIQLARYWEDFAYPEDSEQINVTDIDKAIEVLSLYNYHLVS